MEQSKRRQIGAVIGGGRADTASEQEAFELGRILVDEGFRLVSGGLGGVMRAASRGAHASARYQPGDVIGVLPTYDPTDANEFVDIPICTGLNHARNLIVVATADVVFAVGGESGTLSEIALAWSLGKPVISVGSAEGWARELSGRTLDSRRKDQVHGPLSPSGAVELSKELLLNHPYKPKTFSYQ